MVELIRRLAATLAAPRPAARERRNAAGTGQHRSSICSWSTVPAARDHVGDRRPALSIRRHGYVKVTLADLEQLGTVNLVLRELLAAAVRARLNVLIAGRVGAGKTTLLRALASAIPPHERIITIEDTYELALDADKAIHPDVVPLQSREANVEGEGAIDMSMLFRSGLRMSPDRVIVGEIRGHEVIPMLNAMTQGNDGSLGTIHASSSAGAFKKLVLYAAQAPERLDPATTNLLVAEAVHLVVHLGFAEHGGGRVVTSVREVVDADGLTVASNEVFRPGPHGRAIPGAPPSTALLSALAGHGFDPALLDDARTAPAGGVDVMVLTVPLAALLGAGTALGLLLITAGLSRRDSGPAHLDTGLDTASWLSRLTSARGPIDRRKVALCLAVGVVVGVVTRWPSRRPCRQPGAWVLPQIIGPDRDHTRRVARIEAIATWTEALRDNLSGAAGLEQAITASAIESPEPIREEVTRLAVRLQRSWRLRDALRAYGAEVADPTADLVVAGLLMAARGSAGHLGDVLGELAASARAKVASRQRVAAGRKRNRTSARVIVGATLAMAGGLALLNRGYLAPFDSAFGQLVLLVAGGCFAFAFAWLARLMRDRDTSRILADVAAPADTEARTCRHDRDGAADRARHRPRAVADRGGLGSPPTPAG
ncbi:Flp pilus assembly complex ATPase component TadA, partial [Salinispora arenicola]|nr:Flp pilus assembly complex ATPase component TadA [Salinispora arenicola]